MNKQTKTQIYDKNNMLVKEKWKEKIISLANAIENNIAFLSIRQGMIMLIPLLVTSSMALMIKSLPISVYQEWLSGLLGGRVVDILNFIYSSLFDFFSVLLAVTTSISYSLNKRKKSKIYIGTGDIMILATITLASLASYSGIQFHDTFTFSALSNLNTFSALFVTLVSGKIFFAIKYRGLFRMNKQGTNNDSNYVEAVEGIIPAILIVSFFAVFHQVFRGIFHVDSVQELLEGWVNGWFKVVHNNLGVGILVQFVIHFMWFFGIHGSNVLDKVIKENFTDVSAGIFSKTFQDVFVIMGGCGAILCLVIAILLFARKRSVRNIAKVAAPTVMFNISEIIVFGMPVILNPIFLLPFMIVPILNCVISYIAVSIGLVPQVVSEVEWTTPVLLSGYRATGSWAGAVLQVVCIITGVMIYRPFIRIYEKQTENRLIENVQNLVKELQYEEEVNITSVLTKKEDELGNVARLLAIDLEEAIDKGKLFLVYQPQVNKDGVCIGAEALIRWEHPIVGFIYPPLIIRLAKEKKLLHRLESFLFDEAAAAVNKLQQNIASEFKLSINITNESLEWKGFETCLEKSIEKHGISREKLWLEITEQDALSSSVDIIEKLQNLKEKGHKFLIDDFGMGHTSLMYLQTNYFDVVKLDGALTRDILQNKRNSDIIASIVYLGQSLHFMTVAEYVESKEQRDELARLGCDAFQGYLYSKPILLDELIRWMQANYKN